MSAPPIRFDNGAAYERYMGRWSQLVGEAFLDWLSPHSGLQWLDVGCGNGAFTEMLAQRCAPAALDGVDPSAGQLAFARTRPALSAARFLQGDAMALPFADGSVDAAVMPLVIFFVPDPAKGVAEMARVVRPGGSISAYAWDMEGGGFPYDILHTELRALGMVVPMPPSPEASGLAALHGLWSGAGLEEIRTRTIDVQRSFADFEDYWATIRGGPSVSGQLGALTPEQRALLDERLRVRLPVDTTGRITCSARANAIRGRVPLEALTWPVAASSGSA
jgi:SAM-dependent methyltransferase